MWGTGGVVRFLRIFKNLMITIDTSHLLFIFCNFVLYEPSEFVIVLVPFVACPNKKINSIVKVKKHILPYLVLGVHVSKLCHELSCA